MNILFVCEYDWFKSVVFDIHILAEGLSLLGNRVYVVDYEWDEGSGIRLKNVELGDASRIHPSARVTLERPGFIRIQLKQSKFIRLMGVEFASTLITHFSEIRKIIKEKKIDVIVLYSVLVNGWTSIHFANKFGIPVVFRNIDMLHFLPPNPLKRIVTHLFEKIVYSRVDSLLALTPSYKNYLIKQGAASSKIKLLLFPIDTSCFRTGIDCYEQRNELGFSENDRIIVMMGTLYRFSGLNEFINCFPELLIHVPDAKLLIVGDGPLRPELEATISKLKLTDKVIITGYQPFAKMPQYINMATICINSYSFNSDTNNLFSAKIVQYLACGKATVSTALPGITTLIPNESCGVIYAQNAEEMVKKVEELLKSPEILAKLGQAGIEYVRQHHDSELIVKQLEGDLLQAIKTKSVRKKAEK